MFAMPGARAFTLAPSRHSGGVAFDEEGVFVGGVPLLKREQTSNGFAHWSVRPLDALDAELTVVYRLPIDIARKANALARIAAALNRGDRATAAIATVHMQFPDPPPLAKGAESRAELERRAVELAQSGLLRVLDTTHRDLSKYSYDPNEPRVPAGRREGGQWAKVDLTTASNAARLVSSDASPENRSQLAVRYAARVPQAQSANPDRHPPSNELPPEFAQARIDPSNSSGQQTDFARGFGEGALQSLYDDARSPTGGSRLSALFTDWWTATCLTNSSGRHTARQRRAAERSAQ
jgi:hypothetical protein